MKELQVNPGVKGGPESKRNIDLYLDDIMHTCKLSGK